MTVARRSSQVVVIGAGAAGLFTALEAVTHGARVTLVSATPLPGASSYWAQGGLAAALAPDDATELHLRDTMIAGRGAGRASAAQTLVDEAPGAVRALERLGVRFDLDADGALALGLEGGHSRRRIVHAGGAETGRRIIARLAELATDEASITILEGRRAVRVLNDPERARGVELDDGTALDASAVVIATGGAAALWQRTTNPPGAVGSGLQLAHAAGARLADLELVQFHPTAVVGAVGEARGGADGFLVSEAVRGEGALLINAAGERFVDELAPRDEVAIAVRREMDAAAVSSVGLDMRRVDPGRFPNVVRTLRGAGIDPGRELVPIAPAAHYMMGGIAVDLDGRSSLPGLFAVGECACTGLHGANRLASNSLSECFVFGARTAAAAATPPPRSGARAGVPTPPATPPPPPAPPPASRAALWRDAGIERDAEGLARLLVDPHPLVRLIGCGALAREESRGAHRRRDFPEPTARMDGIHVTLRGERAEPQRWI